MDGCSKRCRGEGGGEENSLDWTGDAAARGREDLEQPPRRGRRRGVRRRAEEEERERERGGVDRAYRLDKERAERVAWGGGWPTRQ